MRLSDAGRKLIKGFEGLSLRAYPDAGGHSIGYGHFGAQAGDVITQAHADQLFDGDALRFEKAVSDTIPIANQAQFDACVSLAYNIGTGAFSGSTLARKHKAGDYIGAANEFARWNKSQGAVHPGLVVRRAKERAVYEGLGYPSTGSGGYGSGPSAGGLLVSTPAQPPTVPPPARRRTGSSGGLLGVLAALFFLPMMGTKRRR
jgi:lysozyme